MSELEGWRGGDRCEKRQERGASTEMLIKDKGERIVMGWDEKRKKSRSRREGKSLEGW